MSKPAPAKSRWLVSTDWLAEHARDPGLVVVDGSWYLPAENRDGFEEYLAAHIPGAIFFDIDEIADHSRGLPHMLPPPDVFALHMARLGIANGDKLVVYDGSGLFSAPRVWWTFRVFGVENVFILDGGFPKWRSEGKPVEAGMVTREPTHFSPAFNEAMVADVERVKKTLVDRSAQVVDSRLGRALSRRGAGAAAGRASGPHARQPEPSRRQARREWGAGLAAKNCVGGEQGRHRPGKAGDYELRLGRVGGDSLARARTRSARNRRRSMTARGPNGAGTKSCRWRRDRNKS